MGNIVDFHALLGSCRKRKCVSLKELSKGLYTVGMMSQIEKGKYLPDYLGRNIILSRLGVSSDDFMDLLSSEEYDRFLNRIDLFDRLKKKDYKGVQEVLDSYFNNLNINKVELQCLYDIKGRLFFEQKRSVYEVYDMFKKACMCTIDLNDLKNRKSYLFSHVEYFLLFHYLFTKALIRQDDILYLKSILAEYEFLLEDIEAKKIDLILKAKCYPPGAYLYYRVAELLLKNSNQSIYREKIINYIDKALLYLSYTGNHYYIIELLEGGVKHASVYDGKHNKYQECCMLFKELYGIYGIDDNMIYNDYIYRNSIVYSLGEFVKCRRTILGLSRADLAHKANCSEKTIMRIENNKNKTQKAIVYDILNALKVYR